MSKMHIHKSITIDAPVVKVFNTINDFSQWRPWSPWLIQEPEAVVTIADDKKYYEWKGNRTGEGNMKITKEIEHKSLDMDLFFLKPWKSQAKVRFEFEEKGDATEVHWMMDSNWPFFLFWMKNMMTAFLGMDYERGLKMLKDYIEDGKVHSELEFVGKSNYEGCTYIGIKREVSFENIGKQMEDDFTKLEAFLKDKEELVAGTALAIYHKWLAVKQIAGFTSAIPVKVVPVNLPQEFISGSIPPTPTYSLKHTGSYEHLGNAWSTLYNMQRAKTFKSNKKIDPFEVYHNDPAHTPVKELLTEVNFPTK